VIAKVSLRFGGLSGSGTQTGHGSFYRHGALHDVLGTVGRGSRRRAVSTRRMVANDEYPVPKSESLARKVRDGGIERAMSYRDTG